MIYYYINILLHDIILYNILIQDMLLNYYFKYLKFIYIIKKLSLLYLYYI